MYFTNMHVHESGHFVHCNLKPFSHKWLHVNVPSLYAGAYGIKVQREFQYVVLQRPTNDWFLHSATTINFNFEDQSSHLQGPIYAEVEAFDQEQTDLISHAMQRHTCYIAPPAMQNIGNTGTVTTKENYLHHTHNDQ